MERDEDEITAAEAAELLGGVAEETVHRYRRRKILTARVELRGVLGRKRYWYSRAEVLRLVEQMKAAQ